MKHFTLSFLIIFISVSALGQQEKGIVGNENWLNSWTDFKPNATEYDKPSQILSGNISKNTKLVKNNTYLLLGDVFVTDSITLTIEPGTVILADFKTKASLIISKTATILAEGTITDPIVFTSNRAVKKPGDWGGIFILGDAPTNNSAAESILNYGLETSDSKLIRYGGENEEGNSGILSFVRIEYAGKRTKDFGYFNGITLAGVGRLTKFNNIMVSFCDGNSFNILGGNPMLTKLVSYKSSSTDYKFSEGSQCVIANSLAIRSPYVSGMEKPVCLQVLNSEENIIPDLSKSSTNIDAENLTLLNLSNNLKNDIKIGLVNEAIYIGKDVSFKLNKSVVSGFKPAVIFDNKIKLNDENLQKIQFINTYFNNCEGNIFLKGYTNNEDLENWYGSRSFNNLYSKGLDAETFIDANNLKRPDFRLVINKITANTAQE